MAREVHVAIIGGGIAGLTAALTAARKGWRTCVLTGGVTGGQLVSIEKIEGMPGFPDGVPGYDLGPMAQEQAVAAGAEIASGECRAIEPAGERWLLKSDGDISARAVIVATGAAFAKLGVEGEARFAGKGVSDCASCDAPLLRGKNAVVVGCGDSAMQEALTLADHLSKVVLLARDTGLSGQATFRERIRANAKIEVKTGTTVSAILGDGAVSHARVKDLASGAEADMPTAAVFVFIGLVPNSGLVHGLVPCDGGGRIVVDAAMRTCARGICAAGNVRQLSPHRAAAGMGDGATAALSVDRYLATGEWQERA
jgi:thioredoxin reductase (NADPH)